MSGFGGSGGAETAIKNYMMGNNMKCILFKVGVEAAILPMFAYLMMLNITRRLAEVLGAHIEFGSIVKII
jgi:hypothetical protein